MLKSLLRRRLIGGGLLGLAAMLSLQPAFADDKPITIGFAVAKSGWMEPSDTGPTRFAEIAIDEINARGGLLGKKIVTTYADTKTDIGQAAKAALEVLDKGAQLVVVSCDYDYGAPAALEAEKANTIAFSTCAGDPQMGVQGVGPHTFTAAQAAQTQGAVIAKWAFEKGYRKPYVLLDTFVEFNKSVCAGFDWAWAQYKDKGASDPSRDTFHFEDPSIGSQITRYRNLADKPDFIVLCSFPPGGATALRQIRAAGIDAAVMTDEGFDGVYWFDSVPNLGEFYKTVSGSVYGNDPRQKVNDLVAAFRKKYGSDPVSALSLSGYLVVQMWAEAVERAKTLDTDAVVAELEKFRAEPTLLGPRTFTSQLHIENSGSYLMMQVKDKKNLALNLVSIDAPVPDSVLFRTKK